MSSLAIRLAEIRSEVTGKDFDVCLDTLLAGRPPRLIGDDVDAFADVPTIRFLHEQFGGDYPISGDLIARHKTFEATASTKKTTEALAGTVVTEFPQEGEVMDNVTTPSIPYPGHPTDEMRTDRDQMRRYNQLLDEWRQQFHPAIRALAPEWVFAVEDGEVLRRHNDIDPESDDPTPLPSPVITAHLASKNYIQNHLGCAQITQTVIYDPSTGSLALAAPYVDLRLPERPTALENPWTTNDLDQIAAGIQDLADVANRFGLPSGLEADL